MSKYYILSSTVIHCQSLPLRKYLFREPHTWGSGRTTPVEQKPPPRFEVKSFFLNNKKRIQIEILFFFEQIKILYYSNKFQKKKITSFTILFQLIQKKLFTNCFSFFFLPINYMNYINYKLE